MDEDQNKEVFQTSSIVLAATLVQEKMQLIGLEPMANRGHGPNLYYFVFKCDKEKREDITMRFSNNTVWVAPAPFMETIRQLKQRTKEYANNK